jgi:myo-inositol 2-dehydrogenase/D-chiro-inositol 1-dehydrogenase
MRDRVRLAVVGIGRIGALHALHARELADESGELELVALVDTDVERARAAARELGGDLQVFASVEELAGAGVTNATVISTPTDRHRGHAEALIDAGHRVLLEKPMTQSLAEDREFVAWLGEKAPHALMLAFQRRFDPALCHAKQLLEQGVIGRPFKLVSILEDSRPLPDAYVSSGLLHDMSVHNVDETLWILGRSPEKSLAVANRLFSHRLTTAEEDFDDGLLYLWFGEELAAQIQVSRNHVAGYRVETWVYGEEGSLHVGRFEQNPAEVAVEVYGAEGPLERRVFAQRGYGRPLPEFAGRFGNAYRAELAEFVARCRTGEPFSVDQHDGFRATEVIDAAVQHLITRERVGASLG